MISIRNGNAERLADTARMEAKTYSILSAMMKRISAEKAVSFHVRVRGVFDCLCVIVCMCMKVQQFVLIAN